MYKLYICAAIFLGLSAVKFFAPEQTENLRAQIINIIDADDDYPQMVETLGRRLSQDGLGEGLIKVFDFDGTAAGEGVPDVVSVFLDSQKKFSGFEIPGNVDTNMPELPFEYAKPVLSAEAKGFGYREQPADLSIIFHHGTDFQVQAGTEVYAFADGTVSSFGTDYSMGNYLIIDHGEGFKTLYAHIDNSEFQHGSRVIKGQVIACIAESSHEGSSHLHFELSKNGMYLNPEYYI